MRKALLLILLMPLLAMSQEKTVVSVNRFFPKFDKIAEFEKALANHAQKYHTGKMNWRVYTIESGPDAGGYYIIVGPATWDETEKRGSLGKEHRNDWHKNVMSLVAHQGPSGYVVYREDLSTAQELTAYTNHIAIHHIFPKPGRKINLEKNLKNEQKVWQAGNQTMAVYEYSASGPEQFIVVTRYKSGLQERERSYMAPMQERYDAIHGAGSFEKHQNDITANVDESWSELLVYKPEFSSK